MNDDIINQALEGTQEAPASENEIPNQPIKQPEEKEEASKENQESEEDLDNQEEQIPFPKKAVNAISRRDRQIARMRAEHKQELSQLKAEIEKFRSSTNTSQRPSPDNYETYDEYTDALIEWRIGEGQKTKQTAEQSPQLTQEQVQQQIHWQQRAAEMDKQDAELEQKLPDYKQFREINSDIFNNIKPEIVQVIYELDNAPLALYALAREGKLEDVLNNSNPYRAAMEMHRAQEKGKQLLIRQTTPTKTPAPIKGVGNSGSYSENLTKMSADEIIKHFNL